MLIVASSVQAYFREALNAAMSQSNINLTESAQLYVVHLLNEFLRSEKAFAGTSHGENVNMVQMLQRAMTAKDHEALKIFRHLGDTCLYLLGFFEASSKKRIVSKSYYRDMGIEAYRKTSELSRVHQTKSAVLFQEMSDRFLDIETLLELMSKYRDLKSEV